MDDEELYRLAALQRFRRRAFPLVIVSAVVLAVVVVTAAVLLAATR